MNSNATLYTLLHIEISNTYGEKHNPEISHAGPCEKSESMYIHDLSSIIFYIQINKRKSEGKNGRYMMP